MGRYIDWSDVTKRYRGIGKDLDSTEVGSAYIPYAEAEVDGRLASKYTVPFSNNNLTAKDLAIDIVYLKAGNLKVEETEKLQTMIDAKFERLLSSNEVMLTTSGDVINQGVAGTVWSTTQNYHPTFGMSHTEYLEVDSSMVSDEEDARQ